MPSKSDTAYFTRRARQSHVAVNATQDVGARLAHAQLEAAYGLLARESQDSSSDADPTTTADAVTPAELAVWVNEGGHV